MKRFRFIAVFILSVLFVVNCAEEPKKELPKEIKNVAFKTSLHCESCVKTVSTKVPNAKGVENVKVDLESKMVSISYDKNSTSEEELKKVLENLGYEAEKIDSLSKG